MARKDNYKELKDILEMALKRCSEGKGKERHNPTGNKSFVSQPICTITRSVGLGFPLGQAAKKLDELSTFCSNKSKIDELLDVIVYASAAIQILMEKEEELHRQNILTGEAPSIKQPDNWDSNLLSAKDLVKMPLTLDRASKKVDENESE